MGLFERIWEAMAIAMYYRHQSDAYAQANYGRPAVSFSSHEVICAEPTTALRTAA